METSTLKYYKTNIKSLKKQITDKNVPTAEKDDMRQDLKQTEMKLRTKGAVTEINEDAPVNSVGNGSGIAGMAGGAAPAGKPSNWNEPGMPKRYQSKYAKKNADAAPKGPVMGDMAKRTPLQSFREFLGK